MRIQAIRLGALEYAVIDTFYTEDELEAIKIELPFIHSIATNGTTASAMRDNKILKNNKSVFVDDIYAGDRQASSVLTLNRKLFDPSVYTPLVQANCFYGHIQRCTADSTMANFYKEQEQYKSHWDTVVLTGITMIKQGEFTGGELRFSEYNENIEFVDNRLVIFPGCVLHETLPIDGNDEALRITLAQFLKYN